MTKRMLIDATQPEETRVVLTSGNQVEDFDFEITDRKILKGNIYLARIVRVEPSLQAAFVEYGGGRHGFLAFNEIHPDYYRIPMEDRQALIESQKAHEARDPDDDIDDLPDVGDGASDADTDGEAGEDGNAQAVGDAAEDNGEADTKPRMRSRKGSGSRSQSAGETTRRGPSHRSYKIQEVITRRQIMLVQVVKDERGNKGAALSTYLSLAGRYCVLMPNTPRGGGVSRKITDGADRKRLKTVVDDLDVPSGMAIIVRTAGSQRTKAEIKRDYEYLLRLWEQIRELTLESKASCLIHEEANLIRRSIRDLYTKDIEEVLVEGDDAYTTAKSFMKTLMPSHARRIKRFSNGGVPLYQQYQVEGQIDRIHASTVQLPSGGYVVFSQTEALVAIDVNSGRATRERNIEETAVKTNLEAASVIARQLRLRDLAGLVVIDFIDMDGPRNQHAVERKMKEEIRTDRARTQLGRISQFGLLEMSRQRLRPSVTEASTIACPHCEGSGRVRTIDSAALHVLRDIEEEGLRQQASDISVHLPSEIGFYILNHKRDVLAMMEQRYGFTVRIAPDDSLISPDHRIERATSKALSDRNQSMQAAVAEAPASAGASQGRRKRTASDDSGDDEGKSRRRRRQPRRSESTEIDAAQSGDVAALPAEDTSDGNDEACSNDGSRSRRRRGRRGGRRRMRREHSDATTLAENDVSIEDQADSVPDDNAPAASEPEDTVMESRAPETPDGDVEAPAKLPRKRAARPRRKRGPAETPSGTDASDAAETPVVIETTKVTGTRTPAETPATADMPATQDALIAATKPVAAKAPDATETPNPAPNDAIAEPVPVKSTQASVSDSATNEEAADLTDVITVSGTATASGPSRRGWWNRSS